MEHSHVAKIMCIITPLETATDIFNSRCLVGHVFGRLDLSNMTHHPFPYPRVKYGLFGGD